MQALTPRHAAVPDEMRQLIQQIVRQLDEIAGLEVVWKNGVVHRGGPHYRLKGTFGPVSLGEDECLIFGLLIGAFAPRNCFIIGNAFGMGSVFIAKMMERHGGRAVVTLDSKSEGDGERCYETAAELRARLACRLLSNKWGWSPQDINACAADKAYDLILIDGTHSHPQVTRDFEGVRHLAHERTIICWHDYWLAGIPESVEAARAAGFACLKINSSCELVCGTRSRDVFEQLRALLPNVEEPRRRLRPVAYLKLYNALMIGAVRAYVLNGR